MLIEVENPLKLLMDIVFLNGALSDKELPEFLYLNIFMKDLLEKIGGEEKK